MLTILFVMLSILVLTLLISAWLIRAMYRRTKSCYEQQYITFEPLNRRDFWLFFARTLIGSAKILSWIVVRRKALEPLRRHHPSAQVVLCVHGFHAAGSCFFGLRRFLEKRGFATYSLNLGRPYIDTNQYIDTLYQTLTTIQQRHQQPVHVVAHSMGGLVTRMMLAQRDDCVGSIASIVTLASPHKGTAAVTADSLPWLKELFYSHSTLQQQLPSFAQLCPSIPCATIGSMHDLVVFPEPNTQCDGAVHHQVKRMNHLEFLTTRSIYELLEQQYQQWQIKNEKS